MDCSEFISRFSDYYDSRSESGEAGPMEAHLESCVSCRRYHRVVTRGGQLLRALPRPSVGSDFRPRLQHRIYHVEDEAALSTAGSSGTTGATALAMAILLTLAAWTPSIRDSAPEVALPPLLVGAPGPSAPSFASPGTLFLRPTSILERSMPRSSPPQGLWMHSHSMLYQYSPLSEKYRQVPETRRSELE